MKKKITCKNCCWADNINVENRIKFSQENKEILNILEKARYRLYDFRYCRKKGFIESIIIKRECIDWEPI